MILTTEKFTLQLENLQIIKDWNLSINEKDFVVIIGKSGTGKTTLLNNLSLIENRYSGDLYYFDKKVKKSDFQKLRRDHISYMFQNYGLLENLTVEQNFKLASKFNKKISKQNFLELLDEFSFSEQILKKKVYLLSGGEQQRIALIRNMLKPFDILFADEPTGNLDNENALFIMDYLKTIAENEHKAVVVVTHDLSYLNYATQVIKLESE